MLTYVSLVVGELVPAAILPDPDAVAINVAPAMEILATATTPVVWLLDQSAGHCVVAVGAAWRRRQPRDREGSAVLAERGAWGGVLEDEEREMMAGVMRLSDRSARALMTPRHEITMIDLEAVRCQDGGNDPQGGAAAHVGAKPRQWRVEWGSHHAGRAFPGSVAPRSRGSRDGAGCAGGVGSGGHQ